MYTGKNNILIGHSFHYCGYYAYDAQGNRAYKLTGYVVEDQHNAGYSSHTAYFDDATLYVNPYMVVTPRGYTKHYYNGNERIAARLADYWNQDNTLIVADAAISRADTLCRNTVSVTESPFRDMEGDEQYIRTDGTYLPIVSYGPYISSIRGVFAEDLLWDVLHSNCHEEEDITDDGIFYCHSDHLGSSSWITSDRGLAVQYIHYMPYGEVWMNQQACQYDERFKFTGKERDAETGYDYFGARYYCSTFDHWTSPDKLSDQYPEISSYAYCKWNPIKNVDPDGNFVGTAIDIVCVGMDLYSLDKNLADGNTQAALIDAGALAIDALAVLVPGVTAGAGIVVKAARAADKGKDVAHATTSIVANSHNYRKALQQATGKAGKGYEAHHTLPQKYRTDFEKAGINIDESGNVVWRKTEEHRKNNHNITQEWNDFFGKHNNPSAEQIYKNRDKIENKYFKNTTGDL